jgi:putative FmdB family regulatory protein
MPIYEYWCPQCRASFEQLRPMGSKDSEVECPQCGSAVKRMLSVFAVAGLAGRGRASVGEDSYSYSPAGGCGCGGACSCGGHGHG